MPRRLTRLDEGLATYLPHDAGPGRVAIDMATGPAVRARRGVA
jgi:hypothetical protein